MYIYICTFIYMYIYIYICMLMCIDRQIDIDAHVDVDEDVDVYVDISIDISFRRGTGKWETVLSICPAWNFLRQIQINYILLPQKESMHGRGREEIPKLHRKWRLRNENTDVSLIKARSWRCFYWYMVGWLGWNLTPQVPFVFEKPAAQIILPQHDGICCISWLALRQCIFSFFSLNRERKVLIIVCNEWCHLCYQLWYLISPWLQAFYRGVSVRSKVGETAATKPAEKLQFSPFGGGSSLYRFDKFWANCLYN